jgi:ABC-type nitrate/sulfonate/bicarbonate transport system substrate-binding protein
MRHYTIIIVLTLFIVTPIFAAARLEPLTVGYSNVTATYAPLWIAVEENIGTKYGLDLKAIYAGRVRPQQLLATGDVPIVVAAGTTLQEIKNGSERSKPSNRL